MAKLSSERGSFLVEVMVGAVVLAIASTAILTGIDGSQDTGRRNKDRSLAATLAQQDIERLRSLPITSISNPGAWNVSWRAPPRSRTPDSSVAESKTRAANS